MHWCCHSLHACKAAYQFLYTYVMALHMCFAIKSGQQISRTSYTLCSSSNKIMGQGNAACQAISAAIDMHV